jgi:hypothetical protein
LIACFTLARSELGVDEVGVAASGSVAVAEESAGLATGEADALAAGALEADRKSSG